MARLLAALFTLWLASFASGPIAWADGAATATVAAQPSSSPPKVRKKESALADRARSLVGLGVLVGIAVLLSRARRDIPWRLVGTGILLQFVLAVLTRTGPGEAFFSAVNDVIVGLLGFTREGARFLFGNLAVANNMPVGSSVIPYPGSPEPGWVAGAQMAPIAKPSGAWTFAEVGSFFAFGVLPTIIFFSSLMAVLYHLGVMQRLVKGIALVMQRTMGTSGSETLSAAGNIFVGQTEAPLLVRPFVRRMTESELMAVMTGGFATVAGGVMAAYVGLLTGVFPDIAGHLLCASVMSAPAALVCAKIMLPERDPTKSETYGTLKIDLPREDSGLIDAAARGASDGLQLLLNVAAMLLAFIALIALLNFVVGFGGRMVGIEGLSLEGIFGRVLAPLAWIMGVPWEDATKIGALMGVKTVVNEFVAYIQLAGIAGDLAHERSLIIATYALCGFANFGSVAIQIGGISAIAPERRGDLAKLGIPAMIAGSLACFMTAAIVGILV